MKKRRSHWSCYLKPLIFWFALLIVLGGFLGFNSLMWKDGDLKFEEVCISRFGEGLSKFYSLISIGGIIVEVVWLVAICLLFIESIESLLGDKQVLFMAQRHRRAFREARKRLPKKPFYSVTAIPERLLSPVQVGPAMAWCSNNKKQESARR